MSVCVYCACVLCVLLVCVSACGVCHVLYFSAGCVCGCYVRMHIYVLCLVFVCCFCVLCVSVCIYVVCV